jgi:hypothetical protein
MPLEPTALPEVLADGWERWARRCAELAATEWRTKTRCACWDVHALVAHVCPDPAMFDMLAGATVDGPAAVTEAAELLRRFNAPDGIAHTMADELAAQAIADAETLTPDVIVRRFNDSAARLRAVTISDQPIRYPAVGSTTLAVVVEVALMEATVHLLDLADAVGGVEPSAAALVAARDLLIAVPDPTAAVEVLAGRAAPDAAVPAIR